MWIVTDEGWGDLPLWYAHGYKVCKQTIMKFIGSDASVHTHKHKMKVEVGLINRGG